MGDHALLIYPPHGLGAASDADNAEAFTFYQMKKARRKHCALAVVRRSQKISPHTDPLPGGAGRPKFNQLEMVTTFTYKSRLVRIDARNFELSR